MHTQEKIEAYIAGKLSGEELQQFEEQLRTDAALAEEVEIHRDMQQHLQSGPKADLWANLEEISNEFEEEEGGKSKHGGTSWRRRLPLLVAGSIGLGIFWYWWTMPTTNEQISITPPPDTTVVEQKTEIGKEQTIEEKKIEKTDTTATKNTPKEEKPEKKSSKKPSFIEEKPTKIEQPIAANFTPNQRLEDLAKGSLRGSDLVQLDTTSVTTPTEPKVDSAIDFHITIDSTLKDVPLQLLLFDNKKESYEAFAPVQKIPFELRQEGDKYRLDFKAPSLSPGLYYCLLYTSPSPRDS